MTIYEELIQRVSNGETFCINFEKRTMKVGKDYLIQNGEYEESRCLCNGADLNPPVFFILDCIENLYQSYRFSLPSERNDSKRRKYFKAMSIDEIPDERLMVAERREVAQANLEGFILCMAIANKLVWDENTMGKWFWQSKKYEDLVILKKWIKKGE